MVFRVQEVLLFGFLLMLAVLLGEQQQIFTGLTIGQTYYLAVDHSGGNGNRGTFDICINPLPNIVTVSEEQVFVQLRLI